METKNIQIIKRRIDEERLAGKQNDESRYYNSLRSSIKSQLADDIDILFIDLIPKNPIKYKWIVELLIDLQSEFTDKVILPKHSVQFTESDYTKMKEYLKFNEIYTSFTG